MGFFKEFKDDLEENSTELPGRMPDEDGEDIMINTLDGDVFAGGHAEDSDDAYTDGEQEAEDDDELPVDETAVITAGLTISGDMDSVGSIDVFGTITGNVRCRGKLTISGTINGDAAAGEMFANDARIDGNIKAKGAVKIGQGTVVKGCITGLSAVIAGAVKGDVDVMGPVIIDSSAVIVGDIKSKTVQINNGATINGRCMQCYSDVDIESIFN